MQDRVTAALQAFTETEPLIHAWVEVNPQPALREGSLSGIPFGVKDIFETAGMATEYGSPLYKGRKGDGDAVVVTRLREAGAVLFGKTQTAAFAYFDPPPTRNPRNPAHTPGGSSSGSAAAVAAGVVPFALGTQTMGSVIRPASFCGVVGFKPTFAALPVDRALSFAPSLDTVGVFAEDCPMCVRVWEALGFSRTEAVTPRFAVPDGLPVVSEEMQSAFERAVRMLRTTGWSVEALRLPEDYNHLLAAARTINDYEGARSHEGRWREHGESIGHKLAELVRRGLAIPDEQYHKARELIRRAARFFTDVPILLTPAAQGSAPEGLASTGDPMMNAVWTALGLPAVCVPMPRGNDLPLGLQMIGAAHADSSLLATASEVERVLSQPASEFRPASSMPI